VRKVDPDHARLLRSTTPPDEHPYECDRAERLTLGEALHLHSLKKWSLSREEARQVVSARRFAWLDPERPVLLRTCAYILLTTPSGVRQLLDQGRLLGKFVEGRWEVDHDDLREFLLERWRESHSKSDERRSQRQAAATGRHKR
jgi:hypothetical protein